MSAVRANPRSQRVDALLQGDLDGVARNWAEDYTVNSPRNEVGWAADGPRPYSSFVRDIERVLRNALMLSCCLLVGGCIPHRAAHHEKEPVMGHAISPDGTVIRYRQAGAGPPLLLVHGTTADHERWSAISPRFESHATVYAMDRRGRGGSTESADHDLMREAEDVAAVLERIGEPAFVLGHSYGAPCVMEGALLSDNVRKMVLYEPPVPIGLPAYPPSVPDRMRALLDQGERESALDVFFREVVRMPEPALAAYRQSPVWESRIRLAETIPRELAIDRTYRLAPETYADLRVPTLLLLGGDSPRFMRQATDAVRQAIPGSVVVLTDQQHIAMDTAPDLFVDVVLHFLLE